VVITRNVAASAAGIIQPCGLLFECSMYYMPFLKGGGGGGGRKINNSASYRMFSAVESKQQQMWYVCVKQRNHN
jgi:hypothetical protein